MRSPSFAASFSAYFETFSECSKVTDLNKIQQLYNLLDNAINFNHHEPIKRAAKDASSKPALLGCVSRHWLSF